MHVKSHLGLQAEGQGRGQGVAMGVGYAWYKLLLHGTGQMLLHKAAQHPHSSPSLNLHIKTSMLQAAQHSHSSPSLIFHIKTSMLQA